MYQPFANALDKNVSATLLTNRSGHNRPLPSVGHFFPRGVQSSIRLQAAQPPNTCLRRDALKFSLSHLADFETEQKRIEQQVMRYPLMKLVDMYFYQIGLEIEAAKPGSSKR